MIAGIIVIARTIKDGKKWLTTIIKPPAPVGEEYFDVSMVMLIDDNIAAAGVVTDSTGKVIWVNGWATHVLRWRKEEMKGKSINVLLQEKSRTIFNQAMADYKNKGYSEQLGKPIRMQCLSKGEIVLPVEITIVAAQHQNKLLFIAKIRDITQQLEEFTVLHRELELYKKVEEDACMGFFRWDFADDKVYMSNNMLDLFDLNKGDNNCSSDVLTDCVISTDRKRVGDTILNAIKSKAEGYEMEFGLRNGKLIKLVTKIEYNESNEVVIINGALRSLKRI